jgi:ATP-dependent RNA circularization protein (DNA/RNA ligase family)
MSEYHKIDTVFKRDPATKFRTLLIGDYSNDAFAYLAGNEWVFTEKVDGTNIRVIIGGGAITFGGKTDNASIPAFLVQRLQEKFLPQAQSLNDAFPEGAIFYGEGYGPRIQKGGGNYRKEVDFVLFDIRVGRWWLQRDAIESIALQFGMDIVPIIGQGPLSKMLSMAENGFMSTWGAFDGEGIVARPSIELLDRSGRRIITKIKHRDFDDVTKRQSAPAQQAS